jgi:anti-sigma factor RsiW
MNCADVRTLLNAHLDEELDVVNDAAVASHLENCPGCAEIVLRLAEQRELLREKLTRHRAPPELGAQIRAALPVRAPVTPILGWTHWARWTALAASCCVLTAFAGYWWRGQQVRTEALGGEITAAHVRARLTGHLIDVESSDRHTVKPWFAGKVDFAPEVPDLAAEGFPLLGGRLERIGERTVATLVYGRRKHTIDVHVWAGEPAPLRGTILRDGYSLRGWSAGGLHFTAVSDTAAEELVQLERLFSAAKP